jgi:hypothetical protein
MFLLIVMVGGVLVVTLFYYGGKLVLRLLERRDPVQGPEYGQTTAVHIESALDQINAPDHNRQCFLFHLLCQEISYEHLALSRISYTGRKTEEGLIEGPRDEEMYDETNVCYATRQWRLVRVRRSWTFFCASLSQYQ